MRTARLETVCVLQFQWPLPAGALGESPNEQVWRGLQWPTPDVTSKGVPRSDVQGVPYLAFPGRWYATWPFLAVEYPTIWPIPWCIWWYLPQPPPCKQTDACECITFPQRYLRAVEMFLSGVRSRWPSKLPFMSVAFLVFLTLCVNKDYIQAISDGSKMVTLMINLRKP